MGTRTGIFQSRYTTIFLTCQTWFKISSRCDMQTLPEYEFGYANEPSLCALHYFLSKYFHSIRERALVYIF